MSFKSNTKVKISNTPSGVDSSEDSRATRPLLQAKLNLRQVPVTLTNYGLPSVLHQDFLEDSQAVGSEGHVRNQESLPPCPLDPQVFRLPKPFLPISQQEFQALERALIRHRRQVASERRSQNSNLIYADVAKSRAIPVQTVVTKEVTYVTDVNHDGTAIQYAPIGISCDQPVESAHGLLFVDEHVPGNIRLHQSAQLETGDPIYQATSLGERSAVFAAFHGPVEANVDSPPGCFS